MYSVRYFNEAFYKLYIYIVEEAWLVISLTCHIVELKYGSFVV